MASANRFQTVTKAISVLPESNPDLTFTLDVAPVQSTVTVRGDREGIVVQAATAGSLMPASLMDLPQSLQVVNRELLDKQKTYQYAESLVYLPNVQRSYTAMGGWRQVRPGSGTHHRHHRTVSDPKEQRAGSRPNQSDLFRAERAVTT